MEAADSRVRIILRLAGCVGGDVRARLGNDLATPSSRVIKPTSFRGGGFLVLLVGHMVLSRMILRPPPSHISILHERANFCVVAKPAGIMVHRNKFSRKDESGIALLQLVRDQVGKQVFPVHRLDGGTSGCLIFAYDSATCAMLQAAMQSPTARKVYLAHVRGDASWVQQHTVSRPIKDSEGTSRDSETFFDCLAACDDALPERSSLMRCTPKTGRWHQLRKHLNGLSHPILGDAKHGDSRVNRWWRSELGFQHLGLHCHEMHLQLPYGDPLSVTCPVRPDLIDVWRQLPWFDQAVEAIPSLAEDAIAGRRLLLAERAREEHIEPQHVRVAAAGRGHSVFHRRHDANRHVLGAAPVKPHEVARY